ncbi:MAG: 16S rRNA processing protein RimM [Desulfobacteraceae bacterium]|nr:16S rRNA processing protein RimM [Desulfobacteraceae bacterium]
MEITLFTLGQVTGVHGLKGFLKIRSFAGSMATFRQGLDLVVRRNGKTDQLFEIVKASPHKKGALLLLSGVDRDMAETLVGAELLVDRNELPEPEEDSYFWEDLIGLEVIDRTAGLLGKIDSVMETGSNDVFVVKGGEREVLVPGLASVVLRVDIEKGEMVIDLPEGL